MVRKVKVAGGLRQLTLFYEPDFKLNTQYGLITYSEWLILEKKRIESDPIRHAKVVRKGNEVALYANVV